MDDPAAPIASPSPSASSAHTHVPGGADDMTPPTTAAVTPPSPPAQSAGADVVRSPLLPVPATTALPAATAPKKSAHPWDLGGDEAPPAAAASGATNASAGDDASPRTESTESVPAAPAVAVNPFIEATPVAPETMGASGIGAVTPIAVPAAAMCDDGQSVAAAPWEEPAYPAAAASAEDSSAQQLPDASAATDEAAGGAPATAPAVSDADLFDDVDAILEGGKGAGVAVNAAPSDATSGTDASSSCGVDSSGAGTDSSSNGLSSNGTSNAAGAFFAKKKHRGAASIISGTDNGAAGHEDPLARPFLCDLAYKCIHPSSTADLDFRPYHCQAALLFADISGYSALGMLPAHAVAQSVNGYFERMLEVVQRFGGSVLSFAGDAVVVLFPAIASAAAGAPVTASGAAMGSPGLASHAHDQSLVSCDDDDDDEDAAEGLPDAAASHEDGALQSAVYSDGAGSQAASTAAAAATAMMERGALYEAGSNTLEGACLCALGCARALQQECGEHAVVGVAKPLRMHVGITTGEFELRVLRPTAAHDDAASPEAFTFASGSVMRDIEAAVDAAATGEIVCTQAVVDATGMPDAIVTAPKATGAVADGATAVVVTAAETNTDGDDEQGAPDPSALLQVLEVPAEDCSDPRFGMAVGLYSRVHKELKEVVPPHPIAGKLAPPTILHRLRAGIRREELAEMRNLVVLFIGMDNDDELTKVDVSTWFTEVFDVLSSASCGILQILDDDKGVHIVAAMNVYEAEDGAADSALAVTRALVDRQCGVKVGVAAGLCFCGLIGSESDYRWDVTGSTCIRACRLMQFASRSPNVSVALDQTVVQQLNDVSQARVLRKAVLLKGSAGPVRVYTNSDIARGRGTVACIAKINDYAVQTRLSARTEVIRTVVAPPPELSRHHRLPAVTSAVVAGTPGSGKKTVVLSAVDGTPFVPILYRASKRAPVGDMARALASWFGFHPNAKLRELADTTLAACEKGFSTQSAKAAAKLIAATVEAGLYTAFIVDRAEIVDEPSVHIAAATIAWAFNQQTAAHQKRTLPALPGDASGATGRPSRRGGGGGPAQKSRLPAGRFIWMFTLTPRSGGFSVASLTSALQTRCAEHQQARAVPCALTLPKATPDDYNGIMNAFGFWSLPNNDRRWLTEVTGGDPGMFREFIGLVGPAWTVRWLEWRKAVDDADPVRIADAAAELARIGFASTKYFIEPGSTAKHRAPMRTPPRSAATTPIGTPMLRSAGTPTSRAGSPLSTQLAHSGQYVTAFESDASRHSRSLQTATGSTLGAGATDVMTLPRGAIYGRAYEQLQVERPDDVEIDVLADGTWSMSEAGRKRGLVMLGHIAATFVARRGSFFDALSPYQQMLLKIIAALTHGAPPSRCLEGVLLQLTKTFLQVKTSTLAPALHAAKELLMLETSDDVDAALAAVGDYEPGVTTRMTPREREVRVAALGAPCPPITPQALKHGVLAALAVDESATSTPPPSTIAASPAGPSVHMAPGIVGGDDGEFPPDPDVASTPSAPAPPPPPPQFWAFRSPAQRHSVAGLLTPAQVRTVCKLAARKMIMDAVDTATVPFAELLDVIVLLHRSGDRKRRDDAFVAVWAHVHQRHLLTLRQHRGHDELGTSLADDPVSSSTNEEGSDDVELEVLREQESVLALLADVCAIDVAALLAKRAKKVAAELKLLRQQKAAQEARRGTVAPSTGSDRSDAASVPAEAAPPAAALAASLRAPVRRQVPVIDFHGPSMPTVVERSKNAEPPLNLGPIGAAVTCLTRVIAYRTAKLSPQFQAARAEPPTVAQEHFQALLDVFERVVPRTTDDSHTVRYTAAEEAELVSSLYAVPKDYAAAMRQSELLLEYVDGAMLPRSRRALAFAHQLSAFDVVVPRPAGRLAQQEQKRLLDQTQPTTSLAGAAAAAVNAASALDDEDADAMGDLGALRRGFKALAGLKEDTDDTTAIEATRDALMALAVCNWAAPAGHARMTPAGLREALQQQWLEPLDLKAIVAMYMMDVAVRRKWRISYLVDAECEVVA